MQGARMTRVRHGEGAREESLESGVRVRRAREARKQEISGGLAVLVSLLPLPLPRRFNTLKE